MKIAVIEIGGDCSMQMSIWKNAVFSDEGLRHLVAEVGASQVIYGTDIPYNWPDTLDLILNATFLGNTEKEAIVAGNRVKLLKF